MNSGQIPPNNSHDYSWVLRPRFAGLNMTEKVRAMGENLEACPVCHKTGIQQRRIANVDGAHIICKNCGEYQVPLPIQISPLASVEANSREAAILSHAIRRRTERGEQTKLDKQWVSDVLKNESVPSPASQVDNLIQWLGHEHNRVGFNERHEISHRSHQAIIGSQYEKDVLYILSQACRSGFVEELDPGPSYRLTFEGWRAYEEMNRHSTESKRAFMAMGYGHADVDTVFKDCFVPAVKKTGFTLWRLDQDPKAGVIDARMEVAIRTSRFVVADVTYGNRGAYWEAGFAEGMGKPVIYTCAAEKKGDIHFDVSHRQYVEWDTDYDAAAERLKACIRATLPVEAIMEDERE